MVVDKDSVQPVRRVVYLTDEEWTRLLAAACGSLLYVNSVSEAGSVLKLLSNVRSQLNLVSQMNLWEKPLDTTTE